MTRKHPTLVTRWMLSPIEITAIVGFVILTAMGLFVSIQDALQLGQALNLNLTQAVILNQGIVNLQRDVQLTHAEVTRLLGRLDEPPGSITRFDFVKIQVNNLALEAKSSSNQMILSGEDLALVQTIQAQTTQIETLINNWTQAGTTETQTLALQALDNELGQMETTVKQLIDRQATAQRTAIIQTRNSLGDSQRTAVLAGGVLLLMSGALAAVIRRTLTLRLERALEADRLKGQLLANVSHELRTPLGAIKGYSQLLHEESYGPLNDDQKNTLQRILINTAQLQGMVNNLLDQAQIEQGKLTLRKAPFAPADLLQTTHAALNILAVNKGIALITEVAPGVPEMLVGDMLRLQQILINLTSNAIKFTELGSVCGRIFMPDANHWAMQVVDTGIGIPPDDQPQVFAPFWQADSSATRKHRGSGLGLSIVKQLADLMDGQITLTSELGQGTTITIVFPMETSDE